MSLPNNKSNENKISPGLSWYQDSITERPSFPKLQENKECDVAIIGGGFMGLSAAYHLAQAGIKVVLVDSACFGDGASGRNGGQLGTGQRQEIENLEKVYGFERAKALFDITEESKQDIAKYNEESPFDYMHGHMNVVHRKREIKECYAHIEAMQRFNYHKLSFMDKTETSERLGSNFYMAGIYDHGTGHVNPLKFVVALAKCAHHSGAKLYENTLVTNIEQKDAKTLITTQQGMIKAERVLVATNGYNFGLRHHVEDKIFAIRSYIAATPPLPENSLILKGKESVADSRFVVRYFRKSIDNRLLFGGAESMNNVVPNDLEKRLRVQINEVYPDLKDVKLSHQWGGTLALTIERMPYVKDIMTGVTYCGGFSGHGVLIAPFVGKLYAEAVLGKTERLKLYKDLKITNLPGPASIRNFLAQIALKWFALQDKF